jgi:hypothetical protein
MKGIRADPWDVIIAVTGAKLIALLAWALS